MNKITSTLTGIALAAGVGIVPAFAQAPTPGFLFSPPSGSGSSSFTFSGAGTSSFIAGSSSVGFNPYGVGASTTAAFSLTGTLISGSLYQVTSLTFNPAGGVPNIEVNPLQFTVFSLPSGATSIASVGSTSDGAGFNLLSAPVPEASTVVSFGGLLALGGLAMVTAKRKKTGVKTAA